MYISKSTYALSQYSIHTSNEEPTYQTTLKPGCYRSRCRRRLVTGREEPTNVLLSNNATLLRKRTEEMHKLVPVYIR